MATRAEMILLQAELKRVESDIDQTMCELEKHFNFTKSNIKKTSTPKNALTSCAPLTLCEKTTIAKELSKPRIQIQVFEGDPIKYVLFKRQFKSRIIETCDSDDEKLNHLLQYTRGEPHEITLGFAHLDASIGFKAAWKEFERRYGDQEQIATSYINRALQWPVIKHDDYVTLDKYGIFLRECLNQETLIELPDTYSRDSIPVKRSQIPRPETAKKWPHLHSIADKITPYHPDIEVGLLLGVNCMKAIRGLEYVHGRGEEPYAYRCNLGWGIVGPVDKSRPIDENKSFGTHAFAFRTQVTEISPAEVCSLFDQGFDQQKDEKLSLQDQKFMKIMEEGIHFNEGFYEMPLPFKDGHPALPNNKPAAEIRLEQLRKRLIHNPKYYEHYNSFMQDLIDKCYAEESPHEDGGWYLPHHGVYHPKKREKLRVVFDASAKHENVALNDCLLKGPDQNNSLIGVLLRFREQPVAIMGDMENMFHRFKVKEEDRKFLQFLWWKDGDLSSNPITYRMTSHIFGAISSPACALYGLRKLAEDYQDEYSPDVIAFLKNDFYVDDGLKSIESSEEAIRLVRETRELLNKGNLRLHKLVSNNREVMNTIPMSERAKEMRNIDLNRDTLPICPALGVQWCVEADSFQFKVQINDKPLTRRGILSTVSSIFDPLGLVSPFILAGKKILQELCRDGAEWDDQVPESIRCRWERWRSDLLNLTKLNIPRCYKPNDFGEVTTAELHHFSDASVEGLGQCSYLRLKSNTGRIATTLVMGKSKVAPSKPVTVPRLELSAAVMSIKVGTFLAKELEYEDITHVYWTDSKVVLGYVNNDAKRFHVFVANRIQQIREVSQPSQWRHVKSSDNPADIASRGTGVTELLQNEQWWSGPDFLLIDEPLSTTNTQFRLAPDDPEVRKSEVNVFATKVETNHDHLSDVLKRFSSWNRATRVVTWCLRFIQKLKQAKNRKSTQQNTVETSNEPLNVQEIQVAEKIILKSTQTATFEKEIEILKAINREDNSEHTERKQARYRNEQIKKTSSLYRLDPFLCEDGPLRVGGRIKRVNLPRELTHPVILPKHHHVTNLIIDHYHTRCGHSGSGITLNEVRASGYWIISGRAKIGSYIWKCVTCRKLRANSQSQKMSDLPADRLEPAPPFTYSAVDFFGPFYVKEGRKQMKRYGAMFSVDQYVYSEQTVVKGEQETAFMDMDQDKIRRELLKDHCDWIQFEMNVPHASHMGGVLERMISSARNALSGLLTAHSDRLDDDSLSTLLTEAEAIVNSRPLTYIDTQSPDSPMPLSPNQLLTLKTKVVMPPPGNFIRKDTYLHRRWRHVHYLANEFWNRWRKEFLPTLQERKSGSNNGGGGRKVRGGRRRKGGGEGGGGGGKAEEKGGGRKGGGGGKNEE
ncbi:uncharacterized protein LOC106156278 [Lingula anatina]|uniref:Uncharacterized protein LOC106156278 n=1 Tax=Lingula anatina TaxID=7574 RepID=A0A1S3HN42_LINAN|nr:uncharacterized protein LOC106156278 [Lingula anatina]|eukprot:XP_013386926.1 uncharacterized protein LOC106156278 [Lingula anatina]